jgi:hypothetical protein
MCRSCCPVDDAKAARLDAHLAVDARHGPVREAKVAARRGADARRSRGEPQARTAIGAVDDEELDGGQRERRCPLEDSGRLLAHLNPRTLISASYLPSGLEEAPSSL